MTPREYKTTKERLGLSHPRMGRLLGISWRQSQRYASGASAIPEPVDRLLKLIDAGLVTTNEVQNGR